MSINPQLLVANAADNASESDAADDQELGEREFFVERLRDVAVQDLEELGTPLEEWGPDGDRFEVRYLVRWLGYPDPSEDTWEPQRNLAGWQPSYDEDLAKVAASKPPGFSLAALHEEAERLNEQWRKPKKKSAAVPAKKSTKQAGASTSTKASAKDEKGKKAKGDKKEKKKRPRTSKDGANPDSSTKSRSGRGSTANASPAPSNSSRVARSLRRFALGESLDQAALNDFIATNAPSSVRSLRFSPPPKHDAHGNLVNPSSDTEDSPTPEPTQQDGAAGATAEEVGYGFAGGDGDLEEGDGPASAVHSSDVKPSIPSAPASGSGAAYGFAAGDSDEDEDGDGPGQDRPAVAVPAPAGETAYGFAGSSDDDDDEDHHDEAMQRLEPAPLPAGSAVNADAPIVPTAETATTSFGFATADDDDTDDDHEAMQPLGPAALPAASAAHTEPPIVATAETATTSFGFAGDDDDDDDDDMYFPDLTPFEQARAAAAVAQPAGQAMLERVKMEERPQGFAGGSDEEEDDDLGGPAVDNAAGDAAATLAQGDVDMEEGTAQDEVSTNNQRGSEARAHEDHRQTPEATPSAETARAEPIGDANTDETAHLGGRIRDVGDEQQKLAESPAADAAMNEPSLATRHEAEVASAAVAQSARAAPESQASALTL